MLIIMVTNYIRDKRVVLGRGIRITRDIRLIRGILSYKRY
jgi:hypothetical protein